MSPMGYTAVVEDIPEHDALQLECEPREQVLEEDLEARDHRNRGQLERRQVLAKRPHSSDQRRLSRGRQTRRINEMAMPRSKSERTPQRPGEELDSSDSGSDTEERPRMAKSSPHARSHYHSGTLTQGSTLRGPRSSSGSSSTVTRTAPAGHGKGVGGAAAAPQNVLSYLQKDSPVVTDEIIKRAVAEAGGAWSPRSASSGSSSGSSSGPSESTGVTSPGRSVNGDITSTTFKRTSSPADVRLSDYRPGDVDARAHRYGTPEMSRGSAKHPHIPSSELTARVANPAHGHAKHLPRAEKLPLTGYELLASKLSNPGARTRRRSGGATSLSPTDKPEASLKPIYRRFEALNHRLLLHLQDELSELEEQLHRLDTADTQTRRLQNCILPASRRRESMTGGELQWHKTDILGKIGYKLGQYNHALTSFKETQNLPAASINDIEEYRTYLASESPIAEIETRFLDPTDDLVCLALASRTSSPEPNRSYSPFTDDALTPMPRKMTFGSSTSPASHSSSRASSRQGESGPTTEPMDGAQVASKAAENTTFSMPVVAALAVIVSMVTFPLITDFSGRIAVVLVTSMAVAALKRNMETI